MTEQTTQLTLPQRAAVALQSAEHEKKLIELAAGTKSIDRIVNKAGRDECHSVAMTLKNTRVSISKISKDAREDATQFQKACIAEEKRLIDLIEPDEKRLLSLRDEWDKEQERIRQEAIEAERKRVQAIKEKIALLANAPLVYTNATHDQIEQALQNLADTVIDSAYAEFQAEAMDALHQATEKMKALSDAAHQREAEAMRVAEERAALARMREEIEARRKEQERLAAEEKAKHDAEVAAERKRLEDELKALKEAKAAAQAEQEAELKAEREKMEAERQLLAMEAKRVLAEREALERAQAAEAESKRIASLTPPTIEEPAQAFIDVPEDLTIAGQPVVMEDLFDSLTTPASARPTEAELLAVLMDYFDTDEDTIRSWIVDIFMEAINREVAQQLEAE